MGRLYQGKLLVQEYPHPAGGTAEVVNLEDGPPERRVTPRRQLLLHRVGRPALPGVHNEGRQLVAMFREIAGDQRFA